MKLQQCKLYTNGPYYVFCRFGISLLGAATGSGKPIAETWVFLVT